MSYRIEVRRNGRAYPIVVCDHCGETIMHAKDGNALWLEAGGAGATYDVHHAHKRCALAFERARPAGVGGRWMWNELDHHFFMLLLNTRHDAREGKRKAELLASLA